MRRFSDRHTLQTLSELNVTPLLDLAFVLLIIFMITTPLMERSEDVVLPSGKAAPNALDPQAVKSILLHRDGHITFEGATMEVPELEDTLTRLHAEREEMAVVIRSHKDLPVQALVTVMDVVQHAHISRVGVVTAPEEP